LKPWFEYPEQQWQEKHAVIVGAGIAGCQLSWHLASLGWRVTLLEREERISSQASGNLAGIISPLMSAKTNKTEQLYLQAFEYTIQQLNTLEAQDAKVDWFGCGVLQLAYSARENKRGESLKSRNLPPELVQMLSPEQASEIAGLPCRVPASYFPTAGFINPTSWCEALVKGNGWKVITTSEAMRLTRTKEQHWSVQAESGRTLASAEVVILCNGKDLNQLTQNKGLPLDNVLGQTTLATANEASKQLKCAINHSGYVTPSYKNTHVFGATFEREFENIGIDQQSDHANLVQLSNHLPKLAATFTSTSSGHASVRSATPDRLPYAGGLPDQPFYRKNYASLKHGALGRDYPGAQYHKGLFVLGGLGSRGLTSSALCAKVLSELINNEVTEDSVPLLEILHPARFLIRELRRGAV